ncbi:hypothetical protein Gohar_022212 [Gossypium harknessii]|uniref:Uncharacterized protein n=1 Tax=Gossypium harknessii TaxID=34285 RepID=A0A7J9I953_9ROSI|nr:hypothetical protein [Gossypium harknessii]
MEKILDRKKKTSSSSHLLHCRTAAGRRLPSPPFPPHSGADRSLILLSLSSLPNRGQLPIRLPSPPVPPHSDADRTKPPQHRIRLPSPSPLPINPHFDGVRNSGATRYFKKPFVFYTLRLVTAEPPPLRSHLPSPSLPFLSRSGPVRQSVLVLMTTGTSKKVQKPISSSLLM